MLLISEIAAYRTRFMVKVRIISKAEVCTFSKGDISGVDHFLDVMQTGKCYLFSCNLVKIANRQFNNSNHRYKMTFNKALHHKALLGVGSEGHLFDLVEFGEGSNGFKSAAAACNTMILHSTEFKKTCSCKRTCLMRWRQTLFHQDHRTIR